MGTLARLGLVALTGLMLAAAGAAPAAAQPLPGTTCSLFPSNNILNADISTLPVSAQSATWKGNMAQNTNLHPDLGTLAQQYGMPVNVAPAPSTGLMPTFAYDPESDHPAEGYPIDQSTLIEGGPSAPSGSDRHALMVNKSSCKLYELYNLQNFTNGQQPQAGSGAVWDLSSNAMRPIGWTSADAAGLPITPLLLRPDEILAGSIAHAIRFTAHCTHSYIWPGSHDAGLCATGFPPMGARFRLRPSFDMSGFAPTTQVVLRAFQHFGLVLADNGSDWYFSGTTDDWWGTAAGDQVVSELKTIPAAQFDAVDESSAQAAQGSYQAVATTVLVPCTDAGVVASPGSSAANGTQVVVTASSATCPNPRYEFWIMAPEGSWTTVQAYSAGATFNWNTAGKAPGTYRYSVWVRDAASPNSYDTYFPGTAYTLTTTSCASVTASAAPASPQAAGTTVTITATASGCPSARYEFWTMAPGGNWTIVQAYSATNTFTWNTSPPAGAYKYSVWARDASSAASYDTYFPGTVYTLTTTPCTGLTASAMPASPQTSGTAITITASASGCANARYEFWIQNPGSSTWTIVQAYSATNTFNWTTTGLPAGTYKYSVWVRDASSGASYDTYFPGTAYTLT